MKKNSLLLSCVLACMSLYCSSTTQAQTINDFTLTDVDAQSHTLYDYLNNGQTVALYGFFIECGSCQYTTPILQEIYEELGTGNDCVEVLALDIFNANSESAIRDYRASKGASFPFFASSTNSNLTSIFSSQFGANIGTPALIIVRPDGSIASATQGATPFNNGNALSILQEETSNANCTTAVEDNLTRNPFFIKAFPNPSHDVLTLTAPNMQEVTLYNTNGQALYTQTVNSNKHEIKVAHLANGLYLLQVQQAGKTYTRKIKIMH